MITQLLFKKRRSEEPLERRQHSQTGPDQKLMRNRGAGEPEVETVHICVCVCLRVGGRRAGGRCAELCGL